MDEIIIFPINNGGLYHMVQCYGHLKGTQGITPIFRQGSES